jgi:hypothetical protein
VNPKTIFVIPANTMDDEAFHPLYINNGIDKLSADTVNHSPHDPGHHVVSATENNAQPRGAVSRWYREEDLGFWST